MADFELIGGHFDWSPALKSFDTFATGMRPAMSSVGFLIQNQMANYPPAIAGSSYRRTGTLGRRWTMVVNQYPGMIATEVGNNTKYAPWVQSDQFQAKVHAGRWKTDVQVLRDNTSSILRILESAAAALFR